jgi:hypothetical protein
VHPKRLLNLLAELTRQHIARVDAENARQPRVLRHQPLMQDAREGHRI